MMLILGFDVNLKTKKLLLKCSTKNSLKCIVELDLKCLKPTMKTACENIEKLKLLMKLTSTFVGPTRMRLARIFGFRRPSNV